MNALKHGVLSRHVVLAHEEADEFDQLLAALVSEHRPTGPTETHLVEEIAGAIWRKRRVLQAEGASINRGLLHATGSSAERSKDRDGPAKAATPFEPLMADSRLNSSAELASAVTETPSEARERAAQAEAELAATLRAAEILRNGGSCAYERALESLPASSADWFVGKLKDGEAEPKSTSLAGFIRDDLLPLCRQFVLEVRSQKAIKAQILGEGLRAERLENLNRYETHLDRKLERALAMLVKLKELSRMV